MIGGPPLTFTIRLIYSFEPPPPDLVAYLLRLEKLLMALHPEVADLKATVLAARDRVLTESQKANSLIADLTTKVAEGGLSDEDKAAIAEIKDVAAGIDPTSPVVLPADPTQGIG